MKTLNYSTTWIEKLRTPAKPSDYISHIDSLKPGPVVLHARVSTRAQSPHLAHQQTDLEWQLERRGFEVIAAFNETGSSKAEYRFALESAALKAKETGATVVAETVCRFIRGFRSKRTRQYGLPSVFDMERLMDFVDGARLATLHHPDMDPNAVRGHQSKRGQAASRNHGGRPARGPGWKKERRELKIAEVLELRATGMSYRRIAESLEVPWSTARDWIARHDGV